MKQRTSRETELYLGLFTVSNREIFSLDWEGLPELEQYFESMEEAFVEILKDEYTKFGLLLEEGGKSLAPEDDGDLAASINFSGLTVTADGVEGSVGTNLVYALRRHEEPYRIGTFPKYSRGAKFPDYYKNGRGVTTRGKSWRGYPAGRKYLANAVLATESYYQEMLQRILERTLNGG
jgi:hypothetical protein